MSSVVFHQIEELSCDAERDLLTIDKFLVSFWYRKTRMAVLTEGKKSLQICLLTSIQHTNATHVQCQNFFIALCNIERDHILL